MHLKAKNEKQVLIEPSIYTLIANKLKPKANKLKPKANKLKPKANKLKPKANKLCKTNNTCII